MQNQVNPQFINQTYPQQYQAMPVYPPQMTQGPSVGAVNIQIFNPTANPQPQGFYQPMTCNPYPCNYNNNFMPQNLTPTASIAQTNELKQENLNKKMSLENSNNTDLTAQNKTENPPKVQDEKAKIPLTDEYIKTLENYLNSPDKKVRLMGAKEVFERFKEDETRKDHPALTALLNKTLQDPAETVKFVALTTLDAGYATGNNETAQILTNMQGSNSSYGEDAALATQILLKMSGNQPAPGTQTNTAQTQTQTPLGAEQKAVA